MESITNLKDLIPDQTNGRKHNPRNVGMITDAIQEVGVSRSGVIDEHGNILAGNGTFEALAEAGIDKVKVVEADGREWVVVKRTGLTKEQKVKLALYDNRTAELAAWDTDNLGLIKDEFPNVLDGLFNDDELKDLFDDAAPGEMEGEDDAPERPSEARTQPGDIYTLGQHRLLCGDSTDKKQVERLMDGQKADMVFTDPPYGINVVGKNGNIGGGTKHAPTTKFRPIIGDDVEFNPLFILKYTELCFIWGGNYFAHLLPKAGKWFVWDKNRPEGLTLSDCELAWSNIDGIKIQKFKCTWDGYHKEGESGSRVHPTQKPIKLLVDILFEITKQSQSVLDLFGGSGSTLIACQKLDRKCFMMELDPSYCDVIVTRFHDLFPDQPIFLNDQEISWSELAHAE